MGTRSQWTVDSDMNIRCRTGKSGDDHFHIVQSAIARASRARLYVVVDQVRMCSGVFCHPVYLYDFCLLSNVF